MSVSEGWLLVRQGGSLWGLRRSSLRELRRCRSGSESHPEVGLGNGETVHADELLGLTGELRVRSCPTWARPFLPAQVDGLAVWRRQPVILLRPGASLPDCFERSERGREIDEMTAGEKNGDGEQDG